VTSPSKLQISEAERNDVTVVTLTGEITLDDGDLAFGRYVSQMIADGKRRIVVDLAGVTYIDSAGVGMMVDRSKRVSEQGGSMRLARLTARSHHLLAMLKLKFVFEIYDDVDAAVKSFAWRPQ
jgi:anti-sigma B factor antagonist